MGRRLDRPAWSCAWVCVPYPVGVGKGGGMATQWNTASGVTRHSESSLTHLHTQHTSTRLSHCANMRGHCGYTVKGLLAVHACKAVRSAPPEGQACRDDLTVERLPGLDVIHLPHIHRHPRRAPQSETHPPFL